MSGEQWGEAVARAFHDAYERLAPQHDYRTRTESAKPWEEVPAANRALMIATVTEVLPLIVADTRRQVAEEIAEHIDDQLVCCDSYERIEATWDDENGTYDMSEYRAVVSSSDYHARCHYAAFAVRIARKHATTEPPAIARGSGNGDSGQETT